jgi:hypothetical protein
LCRNTPTSKSSICQTMVLRYEVRYRLLEILNATDLDHSCFVFSNPFGQTNGAVEYCSWAGQQLNAIEDRPTNCHLEDDGSTFWTQNSTRKHDATRNLHDCNGITSTMLAHFFEAINRAVTQYLASIETPMDEGASLLAASEKQRAAKPRQCLPSKCTCLAMMGS